MPQELAVYPLLTARENLDSFGRLQGLAGADARQAGRLGARAHRSRPIARASRSSSSRAACAGASTSPAASCTTRASSCSTSRPSASIRRAATASTRCSASWRAEGVSLLLTTHHLEEAEARCSRTVIIDHGKVIAVGHAAGAGRSHRRTSPPGHASPRRAARRRLVPRLHRRGRSARTRASVRARMTDVAGELPPLLAADPRRGRDG